MLTIDNRQSKQPHTGHRWNKTLAWIVLALVLFTALDYALYPSFIGFQGPSPNHGENGLWIRYTWYFGQEKGYADLAKRITDAQVKYAYFHVRYVGKSGNLRYRYPENARTIVREMHSRAPGVQITAWIYAGNADGAGSVVLSDRVARAKMVSEAAWLCRDCGFDGVQWDYEICHDGDRDLLDLLDETRAALPAGKILSVATPVRSPVAGRFGWSDAYYREIAKRCDQIAVMGYDSGLWWPRAYDHLMQEQVAHVTADAAVNPACRVLIGVPTYRDGGPSHSAWAENLRVALHGVRAGYQDPATNRKQFAGVALFADYTTTTADWETLRRLWR